MKQMKLFGTNIVHKPINLESVKINSFEYSKSEVIAALIKKGYAIEKWYYESPIEGFDFYDCAVKNGEKPSEENIWYKIAKKEFQKEIKKPQLV